MKQFITLIFFVHFIIVFGQSEPKIAQILAAPHSTTPKISCENSLTTTLLPCDFSGSTFSIQSIQNRLKDMSVVKIYYVNTSFRSKITFDQHALDLKRMKWLNAHFPEFLMDPIIDWEVVEQTGCTRSAEGDAYFHGFILVHRPALTEENRKEEIDALFSFIENPEKEFKEIELDPIARTIESPIIEKPSISHSKIEEKNSNSVFKDGEFALFNHFQNTLVNSPGIQRDRIDLWVKVTFTVSETGVIDNLTFLENYPLSATDRVKNSFINMPPWIPAVKNGQPTSSTERMDIRISYTGEVNGIFLRNGVRPEFNTHEIGLAEAPATQESNEPNNAIQVTSVYKSLNQLDSLKRYSLVMDVTGSMSGSIASMLTWIKKHHDTNPFTSFTFFNDGNNAELKPIGKAGGIYSTFAISEVHSVVKMTMKKGTGGPEISENDLEAVLKAIEIDSSATDILLIGDNYSDIRDIRLLDKITKPVHVLLCAAPTKIRTDYLDVVKQTGGKLYLNGEIIELSTMLEGETLVLQGYNYSYNGRRFRLMEKK